MTTSDAETKQKLITSHYITLSAVAKNGWKWLFEHVTVQTMLSAALILAAHLLHCSVLHTTARALSYICFAYHMYINTLCIQEGFKLENMHNFVNICDI